MQNVTHSTAADEVIPPFVVWTYLSRELTTRFNISTNVTTTKCTVTTIVDCKQSLLKLRDVYRGNNKAIIRRYYYCDDIVAVLWRHCTIMIVDHCRGIEVGSITSRCSGNEPTLFPSGGSKTGLEKTAEIEPSILSGFEN